MLNLNSTLTEWEVVEAVAGLAIARPPGKPLPNFSANEVVCLAPSPQQQLRRLSQANFPPGGSAN